MSLEIYKPGQGKIARVLAYVLGGLLVVFGAVRLYARINRPGGTWVDGIPVIGHVSVYNTIAMVAGALGLLGLHLVLNMPAAADMLIDTEQEMKKVSWPSRREVRNATLVVVLVTVTISLLLYFFDWLLEILWALVF